MKTIYTYLLLAIMSSSATAQNLVSTYTGNGSPGFVNGDVSSAKLRLPFGMCIDKNNQLYIADGGNHCIRKINTQSGQVSTLAGTGVAGWKDGAGDSARFNSPANVCVDDSGNVYVSDFANHRIRKITPGGMVSTVAGSGEEGYAPGRADTAKFSYPRGICVDTTGALYVADSWNHRIRRIKNGMVNVYAGGGSTIGVGSTGALLDGPTPNCRFYTPSGLAIDAAQNIYVADAYNHRIRKISNTFEVTTICGTSATGIGNGGSVDGDSTVAQLNTPTEVFVNSATGELLIGETFGNRIRKINLSDYSVSTFAGSGVQDYYDDVDSLCAFNYPRGVVADHTGNKVYVCDYNNHAIRLIEPMNPIGISGEAGVYPVNLFPNPSSGIFRLSGLTLGAEVVKVFDVTGVMVQQIDIGNLQPCDIDLSGVSKGVYHIKIVTGAGSMNRMAVKQ